MKVLLDTNIILTYLSGRDDPYSAACETVMRLIAEEKIEGCVALHSLSTVWHVTRKAPDAERRGYIRQICVLLTVAGASNEAILDAVDNTDFTDFENALQDCCADSEDADYIVTANIKDFRGHSKVKAITPDELLSLLALDGIHP